MTERIPNLDNWLLDKLENEFPRCKIVAESLWGPGLIGVSPHDWDGNTVIARKSDRPPTPEERRAPISLPEGRGWVLFVEVWDGSR